MDTGDSGTNKKICKFSVSGMHCDACESIIESTLAQHFKDAKVSADQNSNSISIKLDKEHPNPSELEINTLIKNLGYSVSEYNPKIRSIFSIKQLYGKSILTLNLTILRSWLVSFFFSSLLILLLLFLEKSGLNSLIFLNSSSPLILFLFLGFFAGISTCSALIGSILITSSRHWHISNKNNIKSATPHIYFHFGRLLGFGIFGGILGIIGGNVLILNNNYFSFLTILVSVLMFILGMQMLGFSFFRKFKISPLKILKINPLKNDFFKYKNIPLLTGIFTFFLPCGFTLVAQSASLTSGSFLNGSLILITFSLGTFLPLSLISLLALFSTSIKPKFTSKFNLVGGLIVVFFSIYSINGQLNVLGLPSLNDLAPNRFELVDKPNPKIEDGFQILNIVANGNAYSSANLPVLNSSVQTKLVINNTGIQGCGTVATAKGLFDGFINLKEGINIVSIGKPSKGVYKLTCTMGMVDPLVITVI